MAALNQICLKVFVLYLIEIIAKCSANDILGCGGFVKSHVSLDFSKIEIGLYTKAGSLKERTECAPTNGYYFLPLYEKGEYVLKVHPPPGWSFEPSEVELLIDGVLDPCSTGQDINFAFNGFGITGKLITAGQKLGPSGISVQLIDDKGEKRDTVTAVGGDFHFTPVIPGKYTLKASHPRWKLDPAQAVVQVKEGNTALPVGVLAIKGYDVKGSVISYGNPISGLYVLLYSKEESPKFRVEGCNTALLQGVPDSPICHVVTDSSGEFTFGLVPAGEYSLLALAKPPGQGTVSYNIKPKTVQFTVQHDSLYIKNAFEVTGFTVVLSVLTHAGGKGVSGARVLRDGKAAGNTDSTGQFTLPALQPGTYTLGFQHEQCEFENVHLTITSAGPSNRPIGVAARWRVCGSVTPLGDREVTVSGNGLTITVQTTPDTAGKWCTFLPPGVYAAKVDVTEQEQRDGLQFYPVSQKVSVGHAPVDGVTFSQLKARLTGRIQCMEAEACKAIPVTLRPLSADGSYVGQPLYTVATNGEYTFEEVLPGSVEISVPTEQMCWLEARHNVAVTQAHATVPTFEHTGYVIRMHVSHDIEVEYESEDDRGVLQVPQGPSAQCVRRAARYSLTPRGCHRLQPPRAAARPAPAAPAPPTVEFVAISHAVVIRVVSPAPAEELALLVSTEGGPARPVGPLQPAGPARPARPAEGALGPYEYEYTLYMRDGELAVVSAASPTLLFSPSEPQQVVGRARCQPQALTLHARSGLTLAGRLQPPVAGVTITLTSDNFKLTQTTNASGTYSFGPLDASYHYSVFAEKESYVFGEPDARGDISAHKLAEIIVELLDHAEGKPLQGALVSVSGGTYRRNVASDSSGSPKFGSLTPGEYYVKPNMKEYRFEPPHKILLVEEGKSHHVTLRGVRVAWSCVGTLLSLGGAGWPGAALLAVPRAPPACAMEEASTEPGGAFRIRGLLPKCVYTLQLKNSTNPDLSGLKLVKAPTTLEVKDNKDIENVRLIAVQPQQLTDATVWVRAPNPDHYRSLRLSLAPDAVPHTPIHTVKLVAPGFTQHQNPGLMYTLPRLPADNKSYVLQLDSSLPKTTHIYEDVVLYFVSDGRCKSFTIDFQPKVKTSEQELRQTSLLVVPLVLALIVAYIHRDSILVHVTALAAAAKQPRPVRPQRPDVLDKASIDQILSNVNAAGKKSGKKKVQ